MLAERVRRPVHGDGERVDASPRELASSTARLAARRADGVGERHLPSDAGGALRHASPGSRRAQRRHVPQPRVPAALGDLLRRLLGERPGRQRRLDPHRPGDDEHRPVEARGRESEHVDVR